MTFLLRTAVAVSHGLSVGARERGPHGLPAGGPTPAPGLHGPLSLSSSLSVVRSEAVFCRFLAGVTALHIGV